MHELPQPGAIIADRYRVEGSLGQGAMGSVWAATDTRTGRAVALKLLAPDRIESVDAVLRFLNEARAAAKIDHPNVVSILDMGRVGQAPFLVMEHLRGESLAQRISRGRLGAREALDIVVSACRGVAEVHREGVVHRDLKPANIFLARGPDGTVVPKVLDFGVAKLTEGRVGATITRDGMALGTPAYIAPEQIGAAHGADARSDVYSMGVVLYEALTRHLPYDANDLIVLVRKIIEGGAPHLRSHAPDVPSGLDAVVRRAMSSDRMKRHASMDELIADLERFRRPTERPPAPPPYTRPRMVVDRPPPQRRGSLWVILAASIVGLVALVLAAALLFVWASSRRDDRPIQRVQALTPAPAPAPPIYVPIEEPPLPPNPRRPTVGLVFSGDCSVQMDDRAAIQVGESTLFVVMLDSRDILTIEITGTFTESILVPVEDALPQLGLKVRITDGPETWASDYNVPGRSGTIQVIEWDLDRGRTRITFDEARIPNDTGRSWCTVSGRLVTVSEHVGN